MTIEDYKRAQSLVNQSAKAQAVIDGIKKIDPADIRFADSYTSVRMAGIVDSSMLQMVKTMLVAHLETKLAALDAEFQALGGGACESN